ncbi:hypothetical protein [Fibrella aquatilis]|uniref:Uncharacterized protein n=1 Tax=Fibrella aquatilis TaxID=2817059 RepID=A0A939G578_9BACT|nr:hypothetical protein [Fibrella aquatilis]MBO0930854.1 hypothetical protein [Fibrella aquatilis]
MNTYMKIALLLCPLAGSAQTVVTSMQTANNPDMLSMNVAGTRDGRPFRHTLRHNVAGLTQAQRDSLYEQSRQALAALGITNVPGLKTPDDQRLSTESGTTVTITCETCTRKGQLELFDASTVRAGKKRYYNYYQSLVPHFPVTIPLAAGNYQLVYKQRGHRAVELPLTITEGEKKQLTLPLSLN